MVRVSDQEDVVRSKICCEANRISGRAGIFAGLFVLNSTIILGVFGHGIEWAMHLQIGIDVGAVLVMMIYSLSRVRTCDLPDRQPRCASKGHLRPIQRGRVSQTVKPRH